MDVYEVIELFKNNVLNELFHSAADEQLQDALAKAINEAEQATITTYKTSLKK